MYFGKTLGHVVLDRYRTIGGMLRVVVRFARWNEGYRWHWPIVPFGKPFKF